MPHLPAPAACPMLLFVPRAAVLVVAGLLLTPLAGARGQPSPAQAAALRRAARADRAAAFARTAPVVLPSYPLAGLPPAGTAGRLARVTDAVRGVWMDTGLQWMRFAQGVADAREFGARGDGSTDDTAAIQAALDSGAAVVVLPAGTYAVRTLSVPSGVRVAGFGATLAAVGSPSAVLLVDAATAPREHVTIEGISFQGSATSLVRGEGPLRFCTFRDLRVLGGGGQAIVSLFNDSPSLNASRILVQDLDARVGGWAVGVEISRGALAQASGTSFDNLILERIHHWAGTDVISISCPCPETRITDVYGGLFGSANPSVVHVDTDVGWTQHLAIRDVFLETWNSGAVAVRLTGVEASTVEGAEASRVNTTASGVRAVKGTNVRFCEIRNTMIRDAGSSPGTSPAGYYPAVELDASSRDNLIVFLDATSLGNRVLDTGLRNRVLGDKNDAFLATDNDRVTVTGTTQETVVKSLDLPAGALGSRDGLRVTAVGSALGLAGTKTVRFLWGGTPLSGSTIPFAAGETGAWALEMTIWNTSATTQRASFVAYRAGQFLTHGFVNASADTTQPVSLTITAALGDGADSLNADAFLVEPIRKLQVP